MKREVLFCQCHHPEHMMILSKFDDEDEIFIETHLSPNPFWKRVWYGIRYIFGFQSKYGAFGELHTSKEKIMEVLNKL